MYPRFVPRESPSISREDIPLYAMQLLKKVTHRTRSCFRVNVTPQLGTVQTSGNPGFETCASSCNLRVYWRAKVRSHPGDLHGSCRSFGCGAREVLAIVEVLAARSASLSFPVSSNIGAVKAVLMVESLATNSGELDLEAKLYISRMSRTCFPLQGGHPFHNRTVIKNVGES